MRIIVVALCLAALSCGSGGGKKEADLAKKIEIGKKQWAEDYYGDSNYVPTNEEAVAAAERAGAYADMRSIVTASQQYFAEKGGYTEDFGELGIKPKSENYIFSVVVTSDRTMKVRAAGNIDSDEFRDIIEMNQLGDVKIIEDDLRDWKETDGLRHPGRYTQKARDVEKQLKVGMDRRLEDLPEDY